jgi:hypothetical protein
VEQTKAVQVQSQNQVSVTGKEQRLEALEYAKFLFNAGMAPECFKTPEALAVTMLRGAELGFTYSESVTSLYVVKNAVAYYAKTLVYMFERAGGKVELLEWDADHAKIRLSQRGRAPLVVAFTLAECKQAGWNMEPARDENGKPTGGMREKHTWSHMPRIMVLNRTVTNGIKAYSPTSQFVRTFDPDMADQVEEDAESDDDTVDGAVTELLVGIQAQTQEPETIKKEPSVVDWTRDRSQVDTLKAWILQHGLTSNEALKAAKVSKLAEFKGTYDDFIALLVEYISTEGQTL